MMQSGLSRQLFEAWCTDKRNGVLIAGYCVEGTLAKVRREKVRGEGERERSRVSPSAEFYYVHIIPLKLPSL
jgi:Cft2 family RNA processing exonuclease